MKGLIRFNFIIISILLLFIAAPITAQPTLQVYYDERTPYAVTDEIGNVTGLTATPVSTAFKAVGIKYEWKKMPFKRQLITIKANKKKACGIGWFKNPEREDFARFSLPIYQDKPTIVVATKRDNPIAQHLTVTDMLTDNNIKLLAKDSFSYGSYLDGMIEKYQPNIFVVVGSSNVEMLHVLLSGRADYFFVAEEEAEEMIKSAGFTMSQFELKRLTDMPAGNNRYLACSLQVSPETIEMFNQSFR